MSLFRLRPLISPIRKLLRLGAGESSVNLKTASRKLRLKDGQSYDFSGPNDSQLPMDDLRRSFGKTCPIRADARNLPAAFVRIDIVKIRHSSRRR